MTQASSRLKPSFLRLGNARNVTQETTSIRVGKRQLAGSRRHHDIDILEQRRLPRLMEILCTYDDRILVSYSWLHPFNSISHTSNSD